MKDNLTEAQNASLDVWPWHELPAGSFCRAVDCADNPGAGMVAKDFPYLLTAIRAVPAQTEVNLLKRAPKPLLHSRNIVLVLVLDSRDVDTAIKIGFQPAPQPGICHVGSHDAKTGLPLDASHRLVKLWELHHWMATKEACLETCLSNSRCGAVTIREYEACYGYHATNAVGVLEPETQSATVIDGGQYRYAPDSFWPRCFLRTACKGRRVFFAWNNINAL